MSRVRTVAFLALLIAVEVAASGGGSSANAKPSPRYGQQTKSNYVPAVPPAVPASVGVQTSSLSPIVRSLEKSPYGNAWLSPDGSAWFADAADGLAIGAMDDAIASVTIPNVVSAVWGPDSRTLAITTSPGPLVSEDETLLLFVVHSDGTGMRQIGETDAARRIQYVADGEVAFQYRGDLHVVQPDTGADEVVTQLANDPTNDTPFVFSPDGGSICLVRGASPPASPLSLSVLDSSSGREKKLSDAVDIRSWQPCAWSPNGAFLAFADQTEDRHPILHLYDRTTGDVKDLLHGTANVRAFGGLSWMPDGGWLLFEADPGGTEAESGAVYEAINVDSGDIVELFRRGLGLRLSPDGRWVGFSRTEGDPAGIGEWLAELSFE